mgnify:CR=1 FL=1
MMDKSHNFKILESMMIGLKSTAYTLYVMMDLKASFTKALVTLENLIC